jgi:aminoacrylate hydrolase
VRADILLLASEDDMLVPSNCSKQLAERLPGASLATMQWGGHACNVTDPATFNHLVLDFLGS